MSVEANKTIIRRYVETWNRGDLDALCEFWAQDIVHHTRFQDNGYENTKRIVAEIMKAFPDMHFQLDDVLADGDKVVTRMTWSGTHTGAYMGVPATGRKVNCALIGVARMQDGKIIEHWGVTDELHMMQQIGLLSEELLAAMA